ncbi:RseA family anti-sigma factor [Snodgrassella sp. CFCC 13594]|uniref:RseA family anti-sigma factor n=1 Tax=Snodgrassella sp. CFCC 13594 TaxID=1775559 RepID=UPI000833ECB2|nr:RseA family anti-sigma factor [Snodgrassella sp. CFCC 13594]
MKQEEYFEVLSAGLDGETDAKAVLDAVDKVGSERWDAYHAIRVSLNEGRPQGMGLPLDQPRRACLHESLLQCVQDPVMQTAVTGKPIKNNVTSNLPKAANQSVYQYLMAVAAWPQYSWQYGSSGLLIMRPQL